MKKRILCLLLSCLMVLSLCPVSFAEDTDECNFYLEFVDPDEPEIYINWNDQVKFVDSFHLVNLYHKVGQAYIPIDAGSLTSSDPTIVSVEYCATDKYDVGYTGYYVIEQNKIGTATLSYTYTTGGQHYDASYEYTVEKQKQQFYLTTEDLDFYNGFGWSGGGDKSQQGRENLRFYTSQDEESLITNKNALTFPKGAGTFTYKGNGYWDWDPTYATDGTYKIEYKAGGKTQFAYCFVNSDDEPYTGDLLYLTEGTPETNFFSGMGRSRGDSVNGIRFYKAYNDQGSLITGEDGFTFPDGGGTFTYQGDGVWNWNSSTGRAGDYEITYTDGEELYYIDLYVYDAEILVSGTCGEQLNWEIDTAGLLTISGNGEMTDYDFDDSAYLTCAPWAEYADTIQSLVVAEGVTSIGDNDFLGLTNLKSVSLPSSLLRIGESSFAWCYELTDVSFPDNLESIGCGAFYWDRSIPVVNIPQSVSTIGENAFARCVSMTDIQVSSDNPYYKSEAGVLYTKDGTILRQYPAGKAGDFAIPDGVTTVTGEVFGCAYYLTSIHIPESLQYFNNSCWFNDSLATITVDENNPYYKAVDGVLFSKDGTTLITYPAAKADSVYSVPEGTTTVGFGAIHSADNLTELYLPESIIDLDAPSFCNYLDTIYYDGTEEDWEEISKSENESSCLSTASLICRIPGDLNRTGWVDITDMEALYTYLSTGNKVSGYQSDIDLFQKVADFNGDDSVNILDYQALYEAVKSSAGAVLPITAEFINNKDSYYAFGLKIHFRETLPEDAASVSVKFKQQDGAWSEEFFTSLQQQTAIFSSYPLLALPDGEYDEMQVKVYSWQGEVLKNIRHKGIALTVADTAVPDISVSFSKNTKTRGGCYDMTCTGTDENYRYIMYFSYDKATLEDWSFFWEGSDTWVSGITPLIEDGYYRISASRAEISTNQKSATLYRTYLSDWQKCLSK